MGASSRIRRMRSWIIYLAPVFMIAAWGCNDSSVSESNGRGEMVVLEADAKQAASAKVEGADRLRAEFHLKEATRLYREALDLYRRSDPDLKSVEAARCKRLLAQVLTDQGEHGAAEALAVESYLQMKERYPTEEFPLGSEELARSMWLLASIWMATDRTGEAEALYRDAVLWFWADQPAGYETALLLMDTGDCLTRVMKYQEAENALKIAYTHLREQRGSDAPETIEAFHRLIELYELWGRPERAEQIRLEASEQKPVTPTTGSR